MVKSMVRTQKTIERAEPVRPSILPALISSGATLFDALQKIHHNPGKALIVIDAYGRLEGVIDENLLREGLLRARSMEASLSVLPLSTVEAVHVDTPFDEVIKVVFGSRRTLIPVLDARDRVINGLSRDQFHQLLIEDLDWDPRMDFTQLHTDSLHQDAVFRPWGFYKSLLTTEFSQTKIISLDPGQEISCQKHFHREEYWTVIRGEGIFRLDDDRFLVEKGFTVRIPKESVHWIRNTQTEGALILMEVQMGEYFGEDDIVRLSDKYHRS